LGKIFMFTALLLVAALALSLPGCTSQNYPSAGTGTVAQNNNNAAQGIANPASTNCISKGGTLSIVAETGGERGVCTLPGGVVCDEWAYFRGECPLKTGPASDEITISIVPEDKAKDALERGTIDYYLAPLETADVAKIKSDPNTNISLYPAVSTVMGMYVNPAPAETGINPFSNRKARFALNFLIDREQIANEVYGGAAFTILTNIWPEHPSYEPISSTVDSFNISYDKQKGILLLGEAMTEAGATKVNGIWSYNGTPITLILPIYNGTDAGKNTRAIADIVAGGLTDAGFDVQIQNFDNYDNMPQYSTDPKKLQWHVVIVGAIYYSASRYEPSFVFGPDNQEGWWAYNNSEINAAEEMMNNASTPAEWNRANNELTRLYIEDSVGMWLVALDSNFGVRKEVSGIIDDRFVGIRSYGTSHRVSMPGKKSLAIGAPYLYDPENSWNPVVVENIHMMDMLNTIHDPAKLADPITLEEKPFRWGFEIERYSSLKPIPQGAFSWSVDEKKWVAVPANATAMAKVTYDLSRYVGTNWHNGETIGWSDVLYFLASTSDRTYDSEKQKVSSEQYKGTLDSIVGYRISGNKLETYLSASAIDDSSMIAVARMFQRVAPLEIYAANDLVVFTQKKYSYGDKTGSNLTALSLVKKDHISDVLAAMESLTDAQIAPMVTLGDTNYLKSGALAARLKADKAWNNAHSNLVISDGAFYLDYYNLADGSARLKAFRDPSYPFAAGAWLEK